MTPKQLSDKKTTQQTISISPALKDRIQTYVQIQKDKAPKNMMFKSVSAFYNEIMLKLMRLFEQGKTIDDLEKQADKEFGTFIDKFSFKGIIQFYEAEVESNRYSSFHFLGAIRFLLAYRKLSLGSLHPPTNANVQNWIERIRNFMLSNGITKSVNIDIFSPKNDKYHMGIFEYVGNYKNLHVENCKWNAALLGVLGVKISDVIYSEKEIYCRFNVKATDLFYTRELEKKSRVKLIKENLDCLMDYDRLIDDKDYYLWMQMAENKNLIVNFKNNKERSDWIENFETNFKFHKNPKELLLKMMKLFEKLHWISIESQINLSFRLNLTKEKHGGDIEFLMGYLAKNAKISEEEGKYFLE